MFKLNSIAVAMAGTLAMAGCATNQDAGSGVAKSIKGLAVDGYLAAAQVYVDTNNNNKLDDWEPHALTDKDGYFSFNPLTGTNYCADGAPLALSMHCLKTTSTESSARLRFVGGYDLTTSTKFVGTLAAVVSVDATSVTNPVTTLLSYMTDAQKAAFIANESAAAGVTLTAADLAMDYTALAAAATATTSQRWVAKLSMEIHKVVDVIEAGLISHSVADARSAAYKALANVTYTAAGFGAYLVSGGVTTNLQAIITTAAGTASLAAAPTLADIANRAFEVASLSESLFTGAGAATPAMDSVGLKGRMRAIEVLTSGLRDFVNNAAAITPPHAARSAATTYGDASAYITQLGTDTSFVFTLVKGKFFPSVTYAVATDVALTPQRIDTLAGGTLDGAKLAVGSSTDGASLSFGAGNTLSLNISSASGSSVLGGTNTISGTYQTLPDGSLVMNLEPLPGVIVPAMVQVTAAVPPATGYVYNIDFNNTTTSYSIPTGTGFCPSGSTGTTPGTC
ncbi:MAG: hypothetical protein OEW08_07235 [Gammaproteobacteria bacterium]|nr:hypothetical protein [Gammaproteobacteria bacterium]